MLTVEQLAAFLQAEPRWTGEVEGYVADVDAAGRLVLDSAATAAVCGELLARELRRALAGLDYQLLLEQPPGAAAFVLRFYSGHVFVLACEASLACAAAVALARVWVNGPPLPSPWVGAAAEA